MNETIVIPIEEYKKLLEASVRIEVFKGFVNTEKYVNKEDCNRILGFKVEDKED